MARAMQGRGTSIRQLAKQLDVTEGALRYRLKKTAEPGPDGRASQATALDGYEEAVRAIQERLGDGRLTGEGRPCQAQEICRVLARDHGYSGSYRAVVRHLARRYGEPKQRALRRVETPPGVQAQHDWFEVRVPIGAKRGHYTVEVERPGPRDDAGCPPRGVATEAGPHRDLPWWREPRPSGLQPRRIHLPIQSAQLPLSRSSILPPS